MTSLESGESNAQTHHVESGHAGEGAWKALVRLWERRSLFDAVEARPLRRTRSGAHPLALGPRESVVQSEFGAHQDEIARSEAAEVRWRDPALPAGTDR